MFCFRFPCLLIVIPLRPSGFCDRFAARPSASANPTPSARANPGTPPPVSGEEPVPQALPLNQGISLHGSPPETGGVAVRPRGYAYASSGNVGCATSFSPIQLSKIKAPPEAAMRLRRGLGRAANSVPLNARRNMSPHKQSAKTGAAADFRRPPALPTSTSAFIFRHGKIFSLFSACHGTCALGCRCRRRPCHRTTPLPLRRTHRRAVRG